MSAKPQRTLAGGGLTRRAFDVRPFDAVPPFLVKIRY